MIRPLGDRTALREVVQRELAATRPDAELDTVRFLAAGEYTLNYSVSLGGRGAVLRIVTGSQMGLDMAGQAAYEGHALEILGPTGRVPALIGVVTSPGELDFPYLLISFLPGRPLDYATDLAGAAECVAAVHRHDPAADHRLQSHRDPFRSILTESAGLLAGLDGSDWQGVQAFHDRVAAMSRSELDLARVDPVIINTDLNSHNFIVNGGRVWLIDWEKARIGPSVLDVAHFLLPTTTLWRESTAVRLSDDQRGAFIDAYLASRPDLNPDRYRDALRPALCLAALRAISWCAWAVVAGERGDRPIENDETLARSRLYTTAEFLSDLTDELWG